MVVNGRLTGSETVALKSASGHRLRADAAASWDRLASAYKARTGGRTLPITDSYRTISVQERLFLDRYMRAASGGGYYGDVRYWKGVRYVRRRGQNAAAVPGTSNHGWGTAVDAGTTSFTSDAYKDLNAIAGHYGWSNTAGRAISEPWHWEYNPAADRSGKPAPATSTGSTTSGVLQVGSNGPRVEALQRGLNRAFPAYSKLVPDGDFGPATKGVVMEFQRRSGLTADGIVGPLTIAALARSGVKL